MGERKDNITHGTHINIFFANVRRKWGQMRDHLYNFALEVVSCHCCSTYTGFKNENKKEMIDCQLGLCCLENFIIR